MNIPSHHQSGFFSALREIGKVDLQVRYFLACDSGRAKQGWDSEANIAPGELILTGTRTPEEMLSTLPDWRDRIHILSYDFCPPLVEQLCMDGALWCHWSEMPGYRLGEVCNFRLWLLRWLLPLYYLSKRQWGRWLNTHASLIFVQGKLAERALRSIGCNPDKIRDLYYAPASLASLPPDVALQKQLKTPHAFLSVNLLCHRKGTDLIMKAFARLNNHDWSLILCGHDNSGGKYVRLAHKLGIANRVVFTGAYPVSRIASVYALSDVLLLASRFDGWGAVLNEAASLGKAMIGSDMAGASWHLIEDGVSGWRVEAGSVPAMAEAMARFAAAPELAKQFGNAARVRFHKLYSPKKNAERLIAELTKLHEEKTI